MSTHISILKHKAMRTIWEYWRLLKSRSPPPAIHCFQLKPHLLILLNSSTNWGPRIQSSDPTGAILTQTITNTPGDSLVIEFIWSGKKCTERLIHNHMLMTLSDSSYVLLIVGCHYKDFRHWQVTWWWIGGSSRGIQTLVFDKSRYRNKMQFSRKTLDS